MPLLLPEPEAQFLDSDGHPFAAGTIDTFIPGTDTPKDTWADSLGTVLNTQPIVLDAAGRAIIYGSGQYRFVLRDADGNLIYDQLTDSIVSDVMLPVVQAETLEEARDLLGISDAIQAETDRATAAETTLTNNLNAEISRAEDAENTLTSNLNAEVTRAEAAEANLQSQIDAGSGTPTLQHGYGSSNISGAATITFDTPFSSTPAVVASVVGESNGYLTIVSPSNSGFEVFTWTTAAPAGIAVNFSWIAAGST